MNMNSGNATPNPTWRREPGARVQGSRLLDHSKIQAPCVVRLPDEGFRLFYTALGPGKPFAACQGYILSAVSDDGLLFRPEPGIRLAPQPGLAHASLRVLAPSITRCADGRWRMYVETRGPANEPTVICSALSDDLLAWEFEDGIRLRSPGGVGAPRYMPLPGGIGRMYCVRSEFGPGGPGRAERLAQFVASALTSDGLRFEYEPGARLRDRQAAYDSAGITAAEAVPPARAGAPWTLFYSAWQDVPPGYTPPLHPSHDPEAVARGRSEDFAAASIAADMAGYRSRIFEAHSHDGLQWEGAVCAIEGAGYGAAGIDAVHAEDMSLIELDDGCLRMYYAACDKDGNWRIASAIREW